MHKEAQGGPRRPKGAQWTQKAPQSRRQRQSPTEAHIPNKQWQYHETIKTMKKQMENIEHSKETKATHKPIERQAKSADKIKKQKTYFIWNAEAFLKRFFCYLAFCFGRGGLVSTLYLICLLSWHECHSLYERCVWLVVTMLCGIFRARWQWEGMPRFSLSLCVRGRTVRLDKRTDRHTATYQQSTTQCFCNQSTNPNACTPVLCVASILNHEGLQIRTTQVKPQ